MTTQMVHFVRHAQGYHNLSAANHTMHDPLLTPLGESQCRELAASFPHHAAIDCVVASPIRRTLSTALHSFSADLERKDLEIIALPELQETSDLPCDTGSDPAILAKEFAGQRVDLALVGEGWNDKKAEKWAANASAIGKRAREARVWLSQRSEKNIVVVTHGGFLHHLTEDWTDSNRFAGTGWANTEWRSYNVTYTASPFDRHEPHFTETEASKARREVKPLDRTEVEQAKRTMGREAAGRATREAERVVGIGAKV